MVRARRLCSNSLGLYPRISIPAVWAAAHASRRNLSEPRTRTSPQPRDCAIVIRLRTTSVFSLCVVSLSPRSVKALAPSGKKYSSLSCTKRRRTSSGTACLATDRFGRVAGFDCSGCAACGSAATAFARRRVGPMEFSSSSRFRGLGRVSPATCCCELRSSRSLLTLQARQKALHRRAEFVLAQAFARLRSPASRHARSRSRSHLASAFPSGPDPRASPRGSQERHRQFHSGSCLRLPARNREGEFRGKLVRYPAPA